MAGQQPSGLNPDGKPATPAPDGSPKPGTPDGKPVGDAGRAGRWPSPHGHSAAALGSGRRGPTDARANSAGERQWHALCPVGQPVQRRPRRREDAVDAECA